MNDYDETNHSTDAYRYAAKERYNLSLGQPRAAAMAKAQRDALVAQMALTQNAALGGSGVTTEEHPIQRDINHPCWQATISEITDLWLARFGDKWVTYNEIRNDNDDAFLIIFTRLVALNKLESHQLNQPNLSRPITVLRLIS